MKSILLYGGVLFLGLPIVMSVLHIATLPDETKQALAEVAKDLNGRIYEARIICGHSGRDHVLRIHGRTREEARRKIEAQVPRCNVEMLETESAPIWQKVLRSAY